MKPLDRLWITTYTPTSIGVAYRDKGYYASRIYAKTPEEAERLALARGIGEVVHPTHRRSGELAYLARRVDPVEAGSYTHETLLEEWAKPAFSAGVSSAGSWQSRTASRATSPMKRESEAPRDNPPR